MFSSRKKRILSLCDELLSGDDDQVSSNIEKHLLSLFRPKTFNGSESYEIEFEKAYQELCIVLSEHTNGRDIKKMTVIEVYTLMDVVQKAQKNGGR
ncbi:hypothetical protein OAD61_00745 [bacterium]|nr:hypothetical protein [bacterium]